MTNQQQDQILNLWSKRNPQGSIRHQTTEPLHKKLTYKWLTEYRNSKTAMNQRKMQSVNLQRVQTCL